MKKYIHYFVIIMIVSLSSFAIGLLLSFGGNIASGTGQSAKALHPYYNQNDFDIYEIYINDDDQNDLEDEAYLGPARITQDTRIIYEYYYSSSGAIEIVEELPSHFFYNLTIEEIDNMLVNWDVLAFSPQEVRLRKNVEEVLARPYILGAYGGYIAVFYSVDNKNEIKELTTRPISALALEEQERLKQGIEVNGNEELLRALEDFSS